MFRSPGVKPSERKMQLSLASLLFLLPVWCHTSSSTAVELRDYRFYREPRLTWAEARTFCREKHTDLYTFTNQDLLYKLSFHGVEGWVGLHREDERSPWKWSEGQKTYRHPIPIQNQHPDRHCATYVWVTFRSESCSSKQPFICLDRRLLVRENKTWEEALDHCWSLGRWAAPGAAPPDHRYHLASLVTEQDHAEARELASKATTDEVWTGLRFLAGHWRWVAGEQVTYGDIQTCSALGSCGVLQKRGAQLYQIRDCEERRNFFCFERPYRET